MFQLHSQAEGEQILPSSTFLFYAGPQQIGMRATHLGAEAGVVNMLYSFYKFKC